MWRGGVARREEHGEIPEGSRGLEGRRRTRNPAGVILTYRMRCMMIIRQPGHRQQGPRRFPTFWGRRVCSCLSMDSEGLSTHPSEAKNEERAPPIEASIVSKALVWSEGHQSAAPYSTYRPTLGMWAQIRRGIGDRSKPVGRAR